MVALSLRPKGRQLCEQRSDLQYAFFKLPISGLILFSLLLLFFIRTHLLLFFSILVTVYFAVVSHSGTDTCTQESTQFHFEESLCGLV